MLVRSLLVVSLLALATVACTDGNRSSEITEPPHASESEPGPEALLGDWTLQSLNGEAIGVRAMTLSFRSTEIEGTILCNNFRGEGYEASASGEITLGSVEVTDALCPQEDLYGELKEAFFAADSYRFVTGTFDAPILILSGAGQELSFVAK